MDQGPVGDPCHRNKRPEDVNSTMHVSVPIKRSLMEVPEKIGPTLLSEGMAQNRDRRGGRDVQRLKCHHTLEK